MANKHLIAKQDGSVWNAPIKSQTTAGLDYKNFDVISHNIGLQRVAIATGTEEVLTTKDLLSVYGTSATIADYKTGDEIYIVSPEFPNGNKIILGARTEVPAILRLEPALKSKLCVAGDSLSSSLDMGKQMPFFTDYRYGTNAETSAGAEQYATRSRSAVVSAYGVNESPFEKNGVAVGGCLSSTAFVLNGVSASVNMPNRFFSSFHKLSYYKVGNVELMKFNPYITIMRAYGNIVFNNYGQLTTLATDFDPGWFHFVVQFTADQIVMVYLNGSLILAEPAGALDSYEKPLSIIAKSHNRLAQVEVYDGVYDPDVDETRLTQRTDDKLVTFDISVNALTDAPTVAYRTPKNTLEISTGMELTDLDNNWSEPVLTAYTITNLQDPTRAFRADIMSQKFEQVNAPFRHLAHRINCDKFDIITSGTAIKLES